MGDLDCVSCVSDGLCVCSFVPLVVLCVFHLLRFVCEIPSILRHSEALWCDENTNLIVPQVSGLLALPSERSLALERRHPRQPRSRGRGGGS